MTMPEPSTNSRGSLLQRFPVQRILLLLVALALLGLMADIRVEHVQKVRRSWIPWTPIVYSGAMAALSLLTFILWNNLARHILLCLFTLAFAVGIWGFFLHNSDEGIMSAAKDSAEAWTSATMKHPKGPPETAPLAFCGIGLLGMLACTRLLK